MYMIYIAVLLSSFLIAIFLIPKIILVSARKKLLDVPDERKLHKHKSSRLGGITFFPSIFFTIYVALAFYSWVDKELPDKTLFTWLLFNMSACLLMYIVGVADDILGVRYKTKFVYQIIASSLIMFSGAWINNLYGVFGINELSAWIGVPLSIGLLVFIMNAINMIDGINGLASGLSIIALTFYGVLYYHNELLLPTLMCAATIGALLGFFRYNVFGLPKKNIKIFMGDAGTLLVGTIIGLLALQLLSKNSLYDMHVSHLDLIIAYSVLIVPCFDVVMVVIHRLRNRQALFLPDKNHIHHKLLDIGYSHRRALILILSFSTGIAILNILMSYVIRFEYVMLLDIVVYTYLNIMISRRINKIRTKIKKYIMHKQVYTKLFLWILSVIILSSCATSKNIVYFQDEQIGVERPLKSSDITIQPKDQISIVVSSKDPQLAAIFNLPRVSQYVGASQSPSNTNGQVMGYTVNDVGEIDFPTLGKIRVVGMTREQIATLIKGRLNEDLVKDAIVTVEFLNLTYSVIGEVTKPGKYNIDKDRITILEALSSAGDLTIFGQRDKVFLIRLSDNNRITYQLNLKSNEIFSSPAFYVQQNDVIYVEPNSVRSNQSTVNGNSARSVSLWMSVASFLTTIGVLIFK